MFIEGIRTRVKGKSKRVVFPEGGEERALQAAARLCDQGLVQPVAIEGHDHGPALLLGRIE
jgi:phosphate acetyltransferase